MAAGIIALMGTDAPRADTSRVWLLGALAAIVGIVVVATKKRA
jgi:hypothetical protein